MNFYYLTTFLLTKILDVQDSKVSFLGIVKAVINEFYQDEFVIHYSIDKQAKSSND